MNRSTLTFLGITVCGLLSSSNEAFCWGQSGHRIVGELAQKHLTSTAKLKINTLFDLDSKTEDRNGGGKDHLLAQISTWADEIRSDRSMDKYKPWHYINIADGETYQNSEKNPNGDMITAIKDMEVKLRNEDSSKDDKIFALKFLVHLIGDLHQPLHVGRVEDKGANTVRVLWFGKPMNLHAVWDGAIIRQFIDQEKLDYIQFTNLINFATQDEIQKWQSTSYEDWAQEDLELRATVYDLSLDANTFAKSTNCVSETWEICDLSLLEESIGIFGHSRGRSDRRPRPHESNLPKLGHFYQAKNIEITKERLRMAGFRLAGVLNSIFN